MNLSDPSHPVWNMGNDYRKVTDELIYSVEELASNQRYIAMMESRLMFEQTETWFRVKEIIDRNKHNLL